MAILMMAYTIIGFIYAWRIMDFKGFEIGLKIGMYKKSDLLLVLGVTTILWPLVVFLQRKYAVK